MLPVVQVPLFFTPERALFLHVIKGTITVGNDKFSVFWPKWIFGRKMFLTEHVNTTLCEKDVLGQTKFMTCRKRPSPG